MTLQAFRDLLLSADPNAVHYKSMDNINYTRWQEYGANRQTADDAEVDRAYKIQADRYTKVEYDPIADAITTTLNAACIAFVYLVDFEPETGYIHHIWDCEVD